MKFFFKGLKHGAEQFGMNIATLVNVTISLFIYIVGIGATSLTAKIIGKRFLEFKAEKDTYWSDMEHSRNDIQSFYRQF